jgi:hypothetical protein
MKLTLYIITILFIGVGCSSTPTEQTDEIKKKGYAYYTGAEDEYGDFLCKVQSFTHKESGKQVTLIGMIHTADMSFYKSVDQILDQHDLVLEEGLRGLPSFGVGKYFGLYAFSQVDRVTFLEGLVPQRYGLKDRDNYRSADMSIDAFHSEGSFITPLIQLVSLPFMMVVSEPWYLFKRGQNTTCEMIGDEWLKANQASIRHFTLSTMDLVDGPSETLMPGIISGRNQFLFNELLKTLQEKEVNSIAIPWGASHMPTFEMDLLNNGFEKTGEEEWLRSIAVKSYLNEPPENFETDLDVFGIPYLYHSESNSSDAKTGLALSSIAFSQGNGYNRFSLLYGDLFDNITYSNGRYISILPKIFGKPLILDVAQKDNQSRVRFLWFFQIGTLE